MQEETDELLDNALLGVTSGQIPLSWPSQFAAAIQQVCAQAQRDLRIYTRDLDARLFDHPEVVDSFRRIALSQRDICIRILLEDSTPLRKYPHRLIPLIQRLPDRVTIKRPAAEMMPCHHSFLLADLTAVVYRSHPKEYHGYAEFHDRRLARDLNQEFMELWEQAEVERELRLLGI